MFIERFFVPAPPKKKHTALKIAGIVSAVLLTPVAFTCNKKRKSWGFGGLLYSVTKTPSETREGKFEYTITLPGIGFIVKTWRRAARILSITCCTRKAKRAEKRDICDCCDCCDMAGEDLVDIYEHPVDPTVEVADTEEN